MFQTVCTFLAFVVFSVGRMFFVMLVYGMDVTFVVVMVFTSGDSSRIRLCRVVFLVSDTLSSTCLFISASWSVCSVVAVGSADGASGSCKSVEKLGGKTRPQME